MAKKAKKRGWFTVGVFYRINKKNDLPERPLLTCNLIADDPDEALAVATAILLPSMEGLHITDAIITVQRAD